MLINLFSQSTSSYECKINMKKSDGKILHFFLHNKIIYRQFKYVTFHAISLIFDIHIGEQNRFSNWRGNPTLMTTSLHVHVQSIQYTYYFFQAIWTTFQLFESLHVCLRMLEYALTRAGINLLYDWMSEISFIWQQNQYDILCTKIGIICFKIACLNVCMA